MLVCSSLCAARSPLTFSWSWSAGFEFGDGGLKAVGQFSQFGEAFLRG